MSYQVMIVKNSQYSGQLPARNMPAYVGMDRKSHWPPTGDMESKFCRIQTNRAILILKGVQFYGKTNGMGYFRGR